MSIRHPETEDDWLDMQWERRQELIAEDRESFERELLITDDPDE